MRRLLIYHANWILVWKNVINIKLICAKKVISWSILVRENLHFYCVLHWRKILWKIVSSWWKILNIRTHLKLLKTNTNKKTAKLEKKNNWCTESPKAVHLKLKFDIYIKSANIQFVPVKNRSSKVIQFICFDSGVCKFDMEKCENNNQYKDRSNGVTSRAAALRNFFKQQSISSSLSVPIRIAPAWGRMLRFGNTAKFKIDEFLQVPIVLSIWWNIRKEFDSTEEDRRKILRIFTILSNIYDLILQRCKHNFHAHEKFTRKMGHDFAF